MTHEGSLKEITVMFPPLNIFILYIGWILLSSIKINRNVIIYTFLGPQRIARDRHRVANDKRGTQRLSEGIAKDRHFFRGLHFLE